ncbi:MAG: nucleoside hydrolase [Oscillospiraceae bacterium]|nr:nucleoside hydrolase [Oscillospiraceae bacterium]
MGMKRIPVIIDCDPGVDDVLALLLALRAPELDVLGITTVCGNATVEYTSWNATRACLLANCGGVSVYPGAAKPMLRPFLFDAEYCGKDGLCCSDLAGSRELLAEKPAVNFLRDALLASREPVTIVSIAAMTNLGELLRDYPETKPHIKEIVTISGYYWLNPAIARAEWNILYDPEAAELVFASGVPVRALGVDVTAQLQDSYTEELTEKCTGRLRDFLSHSLAFVKAHSMAPGGILVDALAVAAVIAPELACYRRGTVRIDPRRTDQYLTEFHPEEEGTLQAAEHVDFLAYLQLLIDRMVGI